MDALLIDLFVYIVVGAIVIGVTMPILASVLMTLVEAFAWGCERYADFEAWRDARREKGAASH